MSNDFLKFERTVKAPPSQVYHAFTNATALREWCCDVATLDPIPGGRLYMAWNTGFYTSGEYTALAKDKTITFTWHGRGEPGPTNVEVALEKTNDSTQVTLVHSGFGSGSEWEQTRVEFQKGWTNGLKNLASVLETGEDIRFVLRPMMGILFTNFDEEIAAQFEIPVTKGLRLDGTVEGMGAEAAGLQKDDVIVGLNGKNTFDFQTLTNILGGLQAGDTTEVVFYRGAEKKSVMMELSRRPIPDIPESIVELSKALEQKYLEIEPLLNEFLDGITEEESGFKPSSDEWSVKEVLAHLIQGERFYQLYVAELVGSQARWSDDFAGNLQAPITAIVETYPTLADIQAELKRCRRETVILFSKLPAEFVERKGSYWWLAYGALEGNFHDLAHLEQMQNSVQVARTQ